MKITTISPKIKSDYLSASEFNQLNDNFNSAVGELLRDWKIISVAEVGGTVVSGTEGQKQSVLKIPVTGIGTLDFDFKCDFDPHKTQTGQQTLFQLGTTYLKLLPTTPNWNNFFPSIQSKWKSGGLGQTGTDLSLSAWKNSFFGNDCFSIQKISNVTADDVETTIKVTDSAVLIYKGQSTIASFDFETYATVDDIITAMKLSVALTDYEIIAYESAGIASSDLARVDLTIVANREDWDTETNTGLGSYSPDNWPVYVPASGNGITHRCRMTFDSGRVRIWVDGFPVREFKDVTVNELSGDLYLGGNSSGAEMFDGWISNIRIRTEAVNEPVFTVIIAHLTSEDLDGVAQVGQRASIGRMERGIRAMKDLGYEFVSVSDIKDYVLGNKEKPQKAACILYDDSLFLHWTTDRIRMLYQKYGFKAATSIVLKHLDTEVGPYEKAKIIQYINETKQIGWEWVNHSYNHWNHDGLHFSQIKSEVDLAKAVMDAEKLHTDIYVTPQGSGTSYSLKYLNKKQAAINFKYSSAGGYYGGNVMELTRVYWDNSYDFAGFVENLEGKFPT